MSGETFRWWQRNVEDNRSSIIVSAHHYSQGDDAMLARMRTRTNPCLATHQKQTVSVDVIVLVSDQVLTPWRVVTSRTMLPLESYAVVSA